MKSALACPHERSNSRLDNSNPRSHRAPGEPAAVGVRGLSRIGGEELRSKPMKLSKERSYELLAKHGVYVNEVCDKCGQLFGPVRYTRKGERGEWCSRECRDGQEAYAPGTCKGCGARLPEGKRRGSLYCDDACKQTAYSRDNADAKSETRRRRRRTRHFMNCKQCRGRFLAKRSDQEFCKVKCRVRWNRSAAQGQPRVTDNCQPPSGSRASIGENDGVFAV